MGASWKRNKQIGIKENHQHIIKKIIRGDFFEKYFYKRIRRKR